MNHPTTKHFSLALSSALLIFAVCSCSSLERGKRTSELFNGKNLEGWQYASADPQVSMESVFSVRDGAIVCQGTPIGAIYKPVDLTDFKLVVEYRWVQATNPGNSGIFSRINGPIKPLPHAIEVQLMHGNAGDVLGLQGMKIQSEQPRFFEIKAHPAAGDIAGVRKLKDLERTPGAWNRVEVLAEGPLYTVWMNGTMVNQVEGVEVAKGGVGLQSEGGVVEFRRVSLTPHR